MIIPEIKKLNRDLVFRILGLSGPGIPAAQTDAASVRTLTEQIDRCEAAVLKAARPRSVYRILPVSALFGGEENGMQDPSFQPAIRLPGRDIRRLLKDCTEAVFMAVTLGAELERLLMKTEVTSMSDALILDACASAAAESCADDFEAKLRSQVLAGGRYLTNRFSPGYGDLPLQVQRPLLELLNAGRAIGLTVTPTDLMVPRKSVTAILGICAREKEKVLGGCGRCPLREKCSWRSHGLRCYESPHSD